VIEFKTLNKTQKKLLNNWIKDYASNSRVVFDSINPGGLFHQVSFLSEDLSIITKKINFIHVIQIITSTNKDTETFKNIVNERDTKTAIFFNTNKIKLTPKEYADINDQSNKSVESYRTFIRDSFNKQ